jgi:serine/threonine protein kinase/Tol biopolymer transport system component
VSLSARARLGPYEIVAPLGAGGMGEVYRARDTRLDREVAIKVLPSELSSDGDRLKRFEKEARAASSLNHPNIVTIYEVERIDSTSFIVMELVEGKTLREVIADTPLPIRRLLGIGVQIAEGLARAHASGITHRDLKPENVMIGKDGLVKILDFGLAKLARPDLEGRQLTQTPTVSAGTRPGIVMGTVGYMSPEQASGHPVDFRSDQFSFGSVLYEMATGRRAFVRGNAPETLVAIIREEPEPIAGVNPEVPAPVRWIIERCLAKEAGHRYASTEDLARDLASVRDHLSEVSGPGEAVAIPSRRNRLFWLLAVAFATLLAVISAAGYLRRAPRPSLPIRSSLIFPEKMVELENLALSPDGKRLAFAGDPGGPLWIRALDGTTAQAIPVGGYAGLPFWSPDSRFVAFFSDGKLKRVDAAGKTIEVICNAEGGSGGSWGPDGTIVFAPSGTSALYRVSASGGQPVAVTKLNSSRHETSHRYPFFLPDGRHFLYMASDLTGAQDDPPNAIRVASLDGKLDKAVVPTASNAAYASGHLLYGRGETLFARPFDLGRLETAGEPVPIAPKVGWERRYHSQFDARGRLLVFNAAFLAPSTLLWMDRSGKSAGALGEPGFFESPRLSPDGRKVAVAIHDPARNVADIWIYDAATGVGTRFVLGTAGISGPGAPIWSPEGDRILFTSIRKPGEGGANTTLFVKPINGASEEVLSEETHFNRPEDWSPDGRFVSFSTGFRGKIGVDIWILSMIGERKATPFASEAFAQENSRFSPDGRWIAFASVELGTPTPEIYVRPFPGPGGRWQVSTAGGVFPQWRRDGKELFYISIDNKIMAVPVRLDSTFQAGSPAALFPVRRDSTYDVSADGQRFLVKSVSGEEGSRSLTLITDWTALFKE